MTPPSFRALAPANSSHSAPFDGVTTLLVSVPAFGHGVPEGENGRHTPITYACGKAVVLIGSCV